LYPLHRGVTYWVHCWEEVGEGEEVGHQLLREEEEGVQRRMPSISSVPLEKERSGIWTYLGDGCDPV